MQNKEMNTTDDVFVKNKEVSAEYRMLNSMTSCLKMLGRWNSPVSADACPPHFYACPPHFYIFFFGLHKLYFMFYIS